MNLFILDHNFWPRNIRKSIKVSKDSDLSLVSNENFSKTLWPSSWALGQATWAKMTPKLLHLWCQSQKICNPNQKNVFRVQTRRLANPFEPLNSSLTVQSAEELWQGCPTFWAKGPHAVYEWLRGPLECLLLRQTKPSHQNSNLRNVYYPLLQL